MKSAQLTGTIAVTDYYWYSTLLNYPELQEVNFWKPSAHKAFHAPLNSPFYFKLKSPHNAICGFGLFSRYSRLPDWFAWECFGIGNGCDSLEALRNSIRAIRERTNYRGDLNEILIGCVLILEPIFFPRDLWVKQPADWPTPTQSDKSYNLSVGEGLRVWEECKERARLLNSMRAGTRNGTAAESDNRYGDPTRIKPRLGQGTFRVAVTEAYEYGCSVTREHSLPALDASHIRPFSEDGPHVVSNGLLLRADLHRLFDLGYITVTTDLRVEVSKRLKEDYQNGHTYYPFRGTQIIVPKQEVDRPAQEYLSWHNEFVYQG